MFKILFAPSTIAKALLKNMDAGTDPADVARQIAAIPGAGAYIQGATVDTLWQTLTADSQARRIIGERAADLHRYITKILEAARAAKQR
jgi:DNA-binding FrmR family transcriptional regulator